MKICGNSRGVSTWERGSSTGGVRIIIGIAHYEYCLLCFDCLKYRTMIVYCITFLWTKLTNCLKCLYELIKICGIFTNLVFKYVIKTCGIWRHSLPDEDKFPCWQTLRNNFASRIARKQDSQFKNQDKIKIFLKPKSVPKWQTQYKHLNNTRQKPCPFAG
jgi:hypothetical protein